MSYKYLIVGVVIIALLGFVLAPSIFEKPDATQEVPTQTSPTEIPSEERGWETYTGPGYSFSYPAELSTTYIHTVEWPPIVTVRDVPYGCEAGETERGETREVEIDGTTLCVTSLSGGAAGSVYTDYAYLAARGDRTVALSFTLRMTQCANYDEPQMQACTAERESFSADALAARIIESVEIE